MQYVALQRTETRIIELPDECPTGSFPEIIGWLQIQNEKNLSRLTWENTTIEQSAQSWEILTVESVPFAHRWRHRFKRRFRETIELIRRAV